MFPIRRTEQLKRWIPRLTDFDTAFSSSPSTWTFLPAKLFQLITLVFAVFTLRPVIFAYRPRLLSGYAFCCLRSALGHRQSQDLPGRSEIPSDACVAMFGGLSYNPEHNKQEKKPKHTANLFNTDLDLEPMGPT